MKETSSSICGIERKLLVVVKICFNNEQLTPELKNQETSYDRDKKGHLTLLSDQDIHCTFTYRKAGGMLKKSVCNFYWYLSRDI